MKVQLYKGKTTYGKEIEGFLSVCRGVQRITQTNEMSDISVSGGIGYGVCLDAFNVTEVEPTRTIEV